MSASPSSPMSARSVLAAIVLLVLPVCPLSAQWTGTANNLNYNDSANWANGTINDSFTGSNWDSAPASSGWSLTFASGATTLTGVSASVLNNIVLNQMLTGANVSVSTTVGTAFAAGTNQVTLTSVTNVAVGDGISGTGIPAGATITAISGNVVTISANTTAASGAGSYTIAPIVTGIDKTTGTITLSAATYGANSGTYSFAAYNSAYNINLNGSRTVTGNFTYASTDPAAVTFTPNGGTAWTFASATPTISIDMGGTGVARTFTWGSGSRSYTMNFGGSGASGDVTFAVDPSAATTFGYSASVDILNYVGTMTNIHDLTKTGAGMFYFSPGAAGQIATVSGTVRIKEGVMRLSGATALTTADFVSGTAAAVPYEVYGHGSILELSQKVSAQNLVQTNSSVKLYGGGLGDVSTYAQSVGDVTLGNSRNMIGNYSGAANAMTVASIIRQNEATLNVLGTAYSGTYLGAGNNIYVTNDTNILSSLVGGGATSGLATSIVSWATASPVGSVWYGTGAQNYDLGGWIGNDFVTYSTTGGFRALRAESGVGTASTGDYYNANTSALFNGLGVSTYNVNLQTGSFAVAASETINALRFGTSATVTLQPGVTLDITSGAILNGGNFSTIITGGTLSSGINPMIITGGSSAVTSTIGSVITNSITDQSQVGLIIASNMATDSATAVTGGKTVLTGANKYGGYTLVQGNVLVANANALNASAALRIDGGGYVTIGKDIASSVKTLSGTGTLMFSTAANGNQLNVGGGTGANNTVTVNNGGTLSPGDTEGATRTGMLTLGVNVNNVTFNTGSIFEVGLGSGSMFDQIFVTASGTNLLTINGGTLSISLLDGYTPTDGQTWLLTSGFTQFAGLLSNMTVTSTDGQFSLSLAGTNNSDLLLTYVVPEPTTYALMAAGVMVLMVGARRRHLHA